MEDKKNSKINFYSYHDLPKRGLPSSISLQFGKHYPEASYPCVLLVRINDWNDYSYLTHFMAYYIADKSDIRELGIVKIIQSDPIAEDSAMPHYLYTQLPLEFQTLPKKEYFSRGELAFYTHLESLGEMKKIILGALNDIPFHNYKREDLEKLNKDNLLIAYNCSLFRGGYDLGESSEYAKNSIEMLRKIREGLSSINKSEDIPHKDIMINLLYGSVIASLESYLGEAFQYYVKKDKENFNSFLKNYEFHHEKKQYTLLELAEEKGETIENFLKNKVQNIMNNLIFHKLPNVKEYYKKILNINLPNSLMSFLEAVEKRHDIFHRNGKNIAGNDLDISSSEVSHLISDVEKFIGDTETILKAKM